MTKRILKIGALVLALCLLAGIAWFANGLLGNPVSRWLARRNAQAYLAEVYPGTDYVIESVRYSFKSGDYSVLVVSPSSIDTRFTLSLSMTGQLWWDSYQTSVTGRWNTWDRLETEYRALADRVFEDPDFPYDSNIAYGSLWMDQEYGEPAPPGLLLSELELDREYDMQKLGAECGRLCLYVRQEEVTAEAAAEILLDVRRRFDEAGVSFYCIDFVLNGPRNPDGSIPRDDRQVETRYFPYADIVEEGLVARVEQADEEARAYHAARDAEMAAEKQENREE